MQNRDWCPGRTLMSYFYTALGQGKEDCWGAQRAVESRVCVLSVQFLHFQGD